MKYCGSVLLEGDFHEGSDKSCSLPIKLWMRTLLQGVGKKMFGFPIFF